MFAKTTVLSAAAKMPQPAVRFFCFFSTLSVSFFVSASVVDFDLAFGTAYGQDARDSEIFGDAPAPVEKPLGTLTPAPTPQALNNSTSAASAAPSATGNAFIDSMQVGGRLEIRANTGQEEQQKLPDASFSQLKSGDLYFDARPNDDLRGFLRFRLTDQTSSSRPSANTPSGTPSGTPGGSPAPGRGVCSTCLRLELDELWLKWDIDKTVFVTVGKQHVKWGSGRFWNPTDFTASQARDPFALFDRRLGQTLLKLHVPIEKQNFNYYAVVQFDDAQRNTDLGAALRAEFAFAGQGELALSVQTRNKQPLRFGADISTALGPVDVYVESALSTHQPRDFYKGELNPSAGKIPVAYKKHDTWFAQVVGGIQKSFKYSDEDSITLGAEFFLNQLGYQQNELELYSLLTGQSEGLYSGQRYGAAVLRVPSPGSWNKTSFFVNGIQNFSDKTSVARLTATQTLYNEVTLEGFVSRCFGDYGELCFRVPEKYVQGAQSPLVSPPLRDRLASLPTRRTKVTAGLGLSMNF